MQAGFTFQILISTLLCIFHVKKDMQDGFQNKMQVLEEIGREEKKKTSNSIMASQV
jgi:hypothetical protein